MSIVCVVDFSLDMGIFNAVFPMDRPSGVRANRFKNPAMRHEDNHTG